MYAKLLRSRRFKKRSESSEKKRSLMLTNIVAACFGAATGALHNIARDRSAETGRDDDTLVKVFSPFLDIINAILYRDPMAIPSKDIEKDSIQCRSYLGSNYGTCSSRCRQCSTL